LSKTGYDLFVIGAGSGGVRAARIAASHGARVGIAEEDRFGGTCVIRGCVPKKLLVYAIRFRDDFEDAAGFGWDVGEPAFDWPSLIATKDKEIARLEAIYRGVLERNQVDVFTERAIVEGPNTVRCHHVQRGVSSEEAAVQHHRLWRLIHCRRVRLDLRRAGVAGDARLSRREDPARL